MCLHQGIRRKMLKFILEWSNLHFLFVSYLHQTFLDHPHCARNYTGYQEVVSKIFKFYLKEKLFWRVVTRHYNQCWDVDEQNTIHILCEEWVIPFNEYQYSSKINILNELYIHVAERWNQKKYEWLNQKYQRFCGLCMIRCPNTMPRKQNQKIFHPFAIKLLAIKQESWILKKNKYIRQILRFCIIWI